MGGSGISGAKLFAAFAVIGTVAALITVIYFQLNKNKPCKDFPCPDGKTNRVNSKGNSPEECCYTATPTGGTPVDDDPEPEKPEETTTQGGKKKNVGMIVGAAIGGVLLLIIIGFAIFATVGRRSLDPVTLAKLQEAAQARASGVLGSSRLASLTPIATRSILAGSYAMKGWRKAAETAASYYSEAGRLARSVLKKTNPAEAAHTLDESARTGDQGVLEASRGSATAEAASTGAFTGGASEGTSHV